MADPKPKALSFFPLLGFINSLPRNLIPFAAFCSASLNWLVGNQRLLRRSGSLTQVNGVLESQWSALCRRIMPVSLPSLTNNYPTWLALFVNETSKMAQIAFRSTNGTPATRVLGSEFGTYHYGFPTTRTDGVPTFRVVNHVYDNERGGMTIGRLASEKQRRFACGGSRDLLRHGNDIAWGGWTSAPGLWKGGRFNDSVSTGDEPLNVGALGLVPPLQMPTVTAGPDLGTATAGPWRGSDAFFYAVYFENEAGEISRGPVPRPPNSVAVGYVGFGYCQVSAANPTHYFASLVFNGIAIGPPGTKRRKIARSTKVSIDTTTISPFPSTEELYFCATLDNNTQTSFVLEDGSDSSLDTSPVPQQLPGLVWPPRGRYLGRFDGRSVIGCLRPNPYAMIVAPWTSGQVNAEIDDPALYGVTDYAVAVDPTNLHLRKITSGVTTDTTYALANRKLAGLVDLISVNQTYATHTYPCIYVGSSGGLWLFDVYGGGGYPAVYANDIVTATGLPLGTKVVWLVVGVSPYYRVALNNPPNHSWASSATFYHGTISATDPAPWGIATVPGADAQAAADELLRTLVSTTGTSITAGLDTMTVPVADAAYMTAGMLVYSARFTAGTEVVSADPITGAVVVSAPALTTPGAPEAIVFAYDTGDANATNTTGTLAMTGGPSDFHPDAQTTFTTQNSAAGTTDNRDDTYLELTFVAAGATPPISATIEEFPLSAASIAAVAALPTITSVRVTIRCKKVDSTNHPDVTVSGMYTYGLRQSVPLDNTITTLVFDYPTDPINGGAWTAAHINSVPWGAAVFIQGAAAGDATVVYVYEYHVEVAYTPATQAPGYIRMYGNCWPALLPFRKSYLDQFDPETSAIMFTGGSPGSAQDAINTWFVGNRRSGPANFGDVMGFADMGPIILVFFARGTMRLWNQRTGLTHADEDYNLTTSSWTRGLRSPYAIAAGNNWCIYLSDEGLFARGVQLAISEYRGTTTATDTADVLLSKNIYDAERRPGQRGELEYAITACIASSESGADFYPIAAQAIGGLLYVQYWSSAAAGYHDREIRYDFSMGSGRTGIAEVLQDDGSPYPWSTPQTLRAACSAKVVQADGAIHRYAAIDSNGGTTDGRVDEVDTGETDNGVPVVAVGYSGLAYASGMNLIQATVLRAILAKQPPSGISIGVQLNPEVESSDPGAEWADFPLDAGEVMDDFGRAVVQTTTAAARGVAAISARIVDDGTGPPPEITRAQVDAVETASVGTQR